MTDDTTASTAVTEALAEEIPQGQITATRIRKLARIIGGKRYLEIGVCKGETFLRVNLPQMVAVDPLFQFDWEGEQAPGKQFFQITSDEYFACHSAGQQFDVIFLDGLHTFEQTFRDLCAVMAMSHSKTVIVIDDTVPDDIFSAFTDRTLVNKLRRKHGIERYTWHGDIFKMAFAIHDFFPTFDYRTVRGKGNPQTVLIRQPRSGFAPRWNNLEAISRLDYAAFVENRNLLNEASEAEIIDWVQASLASEA